MRNGLIAIATLALIGLTADLALGHGGEYTGGQGGGSGSFGGGEGGGGGTSGGGNSGGGGGGGSTPGSGGGGGATPGGGGGPSRPPSAGGGGGRAGGGRGGGATPGKAKAKDNDRTNDWDFWWDLNDDRYLKLKATIRSKDNDTSNPDMLLGEGDGAAPVGKVTTKLIRDAIEPTLKLGLKDSFFDTRAAAVIALGKIGDDKQPELVAEITKLLADDDKSVAESACLGLGILGTPDTVPLLLSIMKNEPKAREICGKGTKDLLNRQRAFAAVAVGLIGSRQTLDPAVVNELVAAMNEKGADYDLQVFPALALGIMKSQAAVPAIQTLVKNLDGAEDVVRAHAVVALGKLGDKSSVGFLTKDGLTDKSTHVQRSAAIALGLLTDKGDDKSVEALITFSKSAADRGVRNFALIALGHIGNPKGRDHLVFELKKGHNTHDRTFSALALGVYGNKWKDSKSEIGAMILEAWNTTKNDSERGAYAIAMGLLEYKPGAAALIKELGEGGSPNLKGYVATALGLLAEKAAIPQVQELAKRTSDLDVQRRASIALGLMQDPEAVKVLVEVIKGAANNLSALGGAAVALGFIGDRSAVETLTEMLSKTDVYKDNARAFAAVALGILGDKDDLPILTKVQESSNYLARTEALGEILTIY